MFIILLLFFTLITCIVCYKECRKPRKFPPGPRWLPLVGCFLTFQRMKAKMGYLYLVFHQLSKQYGTVLGVKLGRQKIVIVSGNNLIKKVLMKQEFNGRPDGFFFRVRSFGKRKGILFTDGPSWYQTKRMTMKYLSNCGFGHELMDRCLKYEAEMLVSFFKDEIARGRESFSVEEAFNTAVLNTLWTMIAGYRFTYGDFKLQPVLSAVREAFESNDTLGGIISQLPFLRHIIPESSGYNNLMKVLHTLWCFIEDEIDNHVKAQRFDQSPSNFIDAYLVGSCNGETKNFSFDREELIVICLDLFLAGSKTTTDSLTAIFALLLHYPNWMKALQKDIDTVVGSIDSPSQEHMQLLPRVEAFLAEAHRTLILTPLGVPHRTIEDVSLEGYHIPKDTVILLNFHSANTDESCWEKPQEFHPERFLDESGQYRRRNEFIIFGLGKRRCLGEQLAKPSLFLFFTHILHNFDLTVPQGSELPRLDGIDGFTVSPRPYLIKLIPRK
ncbi:methyl farnesoate epoxidase-like [Chelonus insularis]|uniref:methyl farnesoate epoxidase-like n=1 Tax=Chelonus insularis TaxID=460826 RepID=UPI001588E9F0|nr:methyl farnesoate epoxidase-like [Chelonus insularis]